MPFGWHGIFSAMATGGVIFAYQGFEQAVQLGGESARPRRNIPISVTPTSRSRGSEIFSGEAEEHGVVPGAVPQVRLSA